MSKRICNKCNKPLSSSQTKFCSHSCANGFNMAARARTNREEPRKPCDIEGCVKPARSLSAALCPMHYHRVYRNGSLDKLTLPPKWDDIVGTRFGTLTVKQRDGAQWACTCDCGATRTASAGELNRTGDNNTCGMPGVHLSDSAEYGAAHERVRRLHGPAKNHACVDCEEAAAHWSYNHDDPAEKSSNIDRLKGIAFSLKPEHYSPRCVPCHKRFDLDRINAAEIHSACAS